MKLGPRAFSGFNEAIVGVLPSPNVFFLRPVPATVTSDGMSGLKVLKCDRYVCSKVYTTGIIVEPYV